MDYIDQQFEAYLQEELKVKRNLYNYSDRYVNGYHKIGLTIKIVIHLDIFRMILRVESLTEKFLKP